MPFAAEDQELLQELALQAAKVIQNTWLYEQLRLKVHLFESLASVSRTINSTLNLDEALQAITREACVLMRARMCSLMMLDESREWLDLRASYGAGEAYINKPRLAVGDSLLGVVVRRKKPMQVTNVQASTRYQHVEIARREGLVSLLSVPLLFAGQAIGTLSVYTGRPYNFSNEEIRILSALAELSAIAIEKARLYERVVDVEEQLRQNEKLSALGLAGRRGGARNPQSAHGDEAVVSFAGFEVSRKATRGLEGYADHRGKNRAFEQNRGADSGLCADHRTQARPGKFE